MIIYSRVTEHPDSEPITLDQAKTHLEYQGTAKNDFIESLIKVARRICEAYSGLSFVPQARVIRLDHFPCSRRYIELPYGPVVAITSFTYRNEDGDTVELDEGDDFVADYHATPARVYPLVDGEIDQWPADVAIYPNAINIAYEAGYDDISGEPLPEEARQAMLLQIASMFENRQDENIGAISHKINMNSEHILDSIKVYWNANID